LLYNHEIGENDGEDRCEISAKNYEKKFIKEICQMIANSLQINWSDRRIVESLLYTSLGRISDRDGLLEQYLHSQLDEILERFKKEFELSDDVKTDYSHATHAKFKSLITAIKEIPEREVKNDNK